MPNWCENNIEIEGDTKQLDDLEAKLKANKCSLLNTFIPMPPEEPKNNLTALKEKPMPDWYMWALANWGTKWDCTLEELQRTPKVLTGYCNTAWSPPIEGLVKISKLYKKLEFRISYDEPGMGFKGKAIIADGEILSDVFNDGDQY